MRKYCLIYNGCILYGWKHIHKKSGLFYYDQHLFMCKPPNSELELVLFDSEHEARLYLLQYSSFPNFTSYMATASSIEKINKMYLKGSYSFTRGVLITEKKQSEYPYLCEIIIAEYNNSNISEPQIIVPKESKLKKYLGINRVRRIWRFWYNFFWDIND